MLIVKLLSLLPYAITRSMTASCAQLLCGVQMRGDVGRDCGYALLGLCPYVHCRRLAKWYGLLDAKVVLTTGICHIHGSSVSWRSAMTG